MSLRRYSRALCIESGEEMAEKFAIGIDLGGTNLKSGLVNSSGVVAHRHSMPIGDDKSSSRIIDLIIGEIDRLRKGAAGDAVAAGCGIPGIVDFERGFVESSPNLPKWHDVAARDLLSVATKLPIVVDNDANLHALGEQRFGAGRGHKNVILLTLGTGIGGGLILDDKIFRGDNGFAGEVGHLIVEAEGLPCACGGRGCWERYAASHAFQTYADKLPREERNQLCLSLKDDLNPESLARLAHAQNKTAIKLWKLFAGYLGVGIASLVNTLGVFTFVVGGGIVKAWDLFADEARSSALSHTYKAHADRLILKKAELGNDAGVIGASALAFDTVR